MMQKLKILALVSIMTSLFFSRELQASTLPDFLVVSSESEQSIVRMGVEKIWFSPDLTRAVFLRSHASKKINQLADAEIVILDPVMAQVGDLLYFYNFNPAEIKSWMKNHMTDQQFLKTTCAPKIKTSPFDLLLSSAHADSVDCNQKASNLTIIKNSKFFEEVTSILSGDALTKMIGCSATDPKFEKDTPKDLSPANFGAYLKESWTQIKEVIANIPSMEIPDELKSQLTCDAFLVGVMIPQNALLGSTGVGAPLAVARMYNAVKRLLKSAKYLSKYIKKSPKTKAPTQQALLLARTEKIYKNQQMMIRNTQAAIKQILDKGRMVDPKINARYFNELEDWVQAELNLQKDILTTAQKLKKAGDAQKIQSRIKTLEKLTQRDGALSKIDGDDFRIFNEGW